MKLGKYILGLALVAACLTSCDTDNIGAIYEPKVENISFMVEEQSALTKDASIEVPVAISRAMTDAAYTASITLENATPGMSLKSNQVTFAPKEGIAYATVVVSNMEPGNLYTGTINLSAADAATGNTEFGEQITSTTVKVQCDYNWVDAGMCHFIDYNWEDGWEADVPVINAERTNIYRIVDPCQVIYGDANGTYFEFRLNQDGSITVPEGYWNLNYWGYKCYYDSDPEGYGDYCYVVQDGHTYDVNHLLVNGSILYIGRFVFTYPL